MREPYNFPKHTARALAWERVNGKSLLRLSDWNCARDDVVLPLNLLEHAARTAIHTLTHYAETASLMALGDRIRSWLRDGYGAQLASDSAVHLFGNTTQALFGVIYALRELQESPRVLLLHPSYYSVHDAFRMLGIPFTADWRRLAEMGAIPIERLERLRRERQFNIIVLTDPTYSTGIRLETQNWTSLISYCASRGLWLVVDMAFSGLSWQDEETRWQDLMRLSRGGYEKCVVIDSPSKRLFTNNLKLALVYSHRAISETMEKFSDSFTGNLTGMQHAFAMSLYDPANRQLLESICALNTVRVAANFDHLSSVVQGSNKVTLIRPHSGFHTMIFAEGVTSIDVDSMSVCRRLVVNNEIFALPTNDYFYHDEDPFGIRLNLTMHRSRWEGFAASVARSGLI
jgi:aspartate/methionine/tyrosine aminotransferase